MRAASAFVLALLLTGCGSAGPGDDPQMALPPDVVATVDDHYYDVEGATAAEIARSLRENAPVQLGGSRPWGRYQWSLRWRYWYGERNRRCRVTRVRIELTATRTLPRWTPPEGADTTLVRQWNDFQTALRVHENGHRDYSILAAREIRRELLRIEGPTCMAIDPEVRRTAREIFRRYRAQDDTYDRETRGGRTQGVVWPPREGAGRT